MREKTIWRKKERIIQITNTNNKRQTLKIEKEKQCINICTKHMHIIYIDRSIYIEVAVLAVSHREEYYNDFERNDDEDVSAYYCYYC